MRTEDNITYANLTFSDSNYNKFNQPVTGVSYFEAEAYCNWLSEKTKEIIRLPTQHEWLSVLRHDGKRYPWGNKQPNTQVANIIKERSANGAEMTLESLMRINTPSTFGAYPKGATKNNCHDLIGNVWEWVQDFLNEKEREEMISNCKNANELEELKHPSNCAKIVGGCSFDPPSRINERIVAVRFPGYRHYVIGFRTVIINS
ncbi:MAG: SUMF1/EgtB/PvdO family nonheme iron enzyme [Pseudomonadota bacterium]